MKRIKYFYDNYLILITLIFGILSSFTYVFPILRIGTNESYIYRGILVGIIFLLFVLGIVLYKNKPSLKLIIPCSIYLVSNILAISIAPLTKNISIDGFNTFVAISQVAINILSIFIYIWMTKYYYPTKKSIDIVCIFMIAWGVFLAIYSYIVQYQAIIDTFTKEYGWNYDVTSIFTEKTTYGYMLLMCSIFSIIYILNNKKYWMYVFPIFFLINMFISRSKTSILCLVILLVCLLIYHIYTSFNKHKKGWIISISSVLVILVTIMILTTTKVGIFNKFNYYITQVIFNDASVVMKDRLNRWGNVFKSTNNPFLVIFGAGERISATVLGVPTGDSIYINTYATGGIIKFLLYILLIILVMRYNIKNTTSKWNKFLLISIESIILIAGFFEDDALIGFNHTAIFDAVIMFATPKLLITNE